MPEPIRRTSWLDALIILLTILVAVFTAQTLWGLLSQFSDILLHFVLAGLIAFAFSPVIKRLDNQPLPSTVVRLTERLLGRPVAQRVERFRVPRLVAVAFLYVALALVLFGVMALLIPPVIQQLEQLTRPEFTERVTGVTTSLLQWLAGFGVRSNDVSTVLSGGLGSLQTLTATAVQNTFVILGGAVTLVGNLMLVLLLSFFFALDGPRLTRQAFELVPKQYAEDVQMLTVTIDRVFGGYLRATLLQAFLVGVGTAAVMGIFGEPYILVASLFAGLFMLVPFVGTALALVPPVLATLSHDPAQAPWIFTILLIYQLMVVNVLMPKLLSDALGLHPLIVMASLLGGVKIGGFWGALFAVPVAGVIATMILFFYRRAKHTDVPPDQASATIKPTALSTVASTQEASPEEASFNRLDSDRV